MDKMTASRLTGGNPGKKRSATDYYPTPWDVTQALLNTGIVPTGAKVWECACGAGHMVEVMERNGLQVFGSDIMQGVDFLEVDMPKGTEWIITNPPFSLAEEFIERCVQHGRPFALLLKSQFWHARKRYRLFLENGPAYILPLTWRPDFLFEERKEGERGASLMDVCWCVWDGKPLFTKYIPLRKPEKQIGG